MKKIMFAVMAMCAIGFTACGNKAQTAEAPADEVEAVVYNAEEEAAASINQLTEQIEAQDASKSVVNCFRLYSFRVENSLGLNSNVVILR